MTKLVQLALVIVVLYFICNNNLKSMAINTGLLVITFALIVLLEDE